MQNKRININEMQKTKTKHLSITDEKVNKTFKQRILEIQASNKLSSSGTHRGTNFKHSFLNKFIHGFD
jgi:hypothetical protein